MLEFYYETDAIRVSYDESLQLGVGEWKGFVSSNDMRATFVESMAFVTKHSITCWLSDRRKMKAIRQQDQQWMLDEIVPMMLKSKLRRIGTVVSEDIFNQMAMAQMLKRSGDLGGITLREFETPTTAMEWLKLPINEL